MSKDQDDLGYWGKLFSDKRRRAAAIAELVEAHEDEVKAALEPKPAPKAKPKAAK